MLVYSGFSYLSYLLMINYSFDRSRRDCEGGFFCCVANRFTTQNGKITAKRCVTLFIFVKKFF